MAIDWVYLFLDCEVLPALEMTEEQKHQHALALVPKDEQNRETWAETNRERLWRETSLHPLRGRMLMTAYTIGRADPADVYVDYPMPATLPKEAYDEAEKTMFRELNERFSSLPGNALVRWCGYNIIGYDLVFLWMRAIKYGFYELARRIPYQKWDKRAKDVMEIIAGPNPKNARYMKLAELSAFLGAAGKTDGVDGGKVYDLWLEGQHDKIREYGKQDVVVVREVARHVKAAGLM
jgi:hypothetical protein